MSGGLVLILKFLLAGVIWFYIFSLMVSGKNVLTHVQVMKNKNPAIQKIEGRVESKIAKIKEKLGVSTPPEPPVKMPNVTKKKTKKF